jgi:hypothetical protein
MTLRMLFSGLFLSFALIACQAPAGPDSFSLASPEGKLRFEIGLDAEQALVYQVYFNDRVVIDSSTVGFDFKGMPALGKGLEITGSSTSEIRETWEMPWGEQRTVENNGNELIIDFKETAAPNRLFSMTFRAYDDGVAFRYHFPEQEGMSDVVIMDENTEFMLTGDHKAWWIPWRLGYLRAHL